ncbi:WD40 repeat-like protein [Thelephora ganbajun]|uniref:WD40 repeat-like protein n=1 Tax=Thelephora ganbajun TaxID=370292 RepID=A0ACB6YXT0_THEGA|nr:WD40 repeat-like protein [Thelephora ganbajun]
MSQDGYELDVTLTGHSGTITTLQFSPDCKFLASGSNHGVLLVFSTSSWRPLKRLIDVSPITTIVWHDTERYLLLCGCESGDLHFLNFTKSSVRLLPLRSHSSCDQQQEISTDSTSRFDGPIRSLSFSPATPTLAVGYGEEVSITGMTFNPYGLDKSERLLPNPPPKLQSPAGGPPQLVAMSLHFLRKGNQLVVTYLNYDIVCWDLSAMSVVGRIAPPPCSIGRSAISRDCNTMVTSNLVDGVDWYSLSSLKLISSSKVPISKGSSVSSLAFIDSNSDNAIVVGGLSGQAYILDRKTFNVRQELNHNGVYAL